MDILWYTLKQNIFIFLLLICFRFTEHFGQSGFLFLFLLMTPADWWLKTILKTVLNIRSEYKYWPKSMVCAHIYIYIYTHLYNCIKCFTYLLFNFFTLRHYLINSAIFHPIKNRTRLIRLLLPETVTRSWWKGLTWRAQFGQTIPFVSRSIVRRSRSANCEEINNVTTTDLCASSSDLAIYLFFSSFRSMEQHLPSKCQTWFEDFIRTLFEMDSYWNYSIIL